MRVRKTWIGVVLLVLFAVAACGRDPSPDPAAESAAPSVPLSDEAGSDTAAATFLDGTWEARTTRDAYLDYLVDHGVRRADAGRRRARPRRLALLGAVHPGALQRDRSHRRLVAAW